MDQRDNRFYREAPVKADATDWQARAHTEATDAIERRLDRLRAAEARAESLSAQVERLTDALRVIDRCFEAAFVEGLAERMAEGDADTGTLVDLVNRRLLPAWEISVSALSSLPPTAEPSTIDLSWLPDYLAWNRETFPNQPASGIAAHLIKEAGEARDKPSDITEWGDCLLLTFAGADRAGHAPVAVIAAAGRKFCEVLVHREWNKPSADGAIQHVAQPTAVEAAKMAVVEAVRRMRPIDRPERLDDALTALETIEAAKEPEL